MIIKRKKNLLQFSKEEIINLAILDSTFLLKIAGAENSPTPPAI
jgi:hypothetical protein